MEPTQKPPSSLPRTSHLAPWIALGAGLGALALMPNPDPVAVADASVPTVRIATVDPAISSVSETPAARPSMALPAPPLPAAPGVRFLVASPSIGGIVTAHTEAQTDPTSLSKPAQIDRIFAVAGEQVKPLPEGFYHPLVSSRVPDVLADQQVVRDRVNPYLVGVDAKYADPSQEQWANLRWCEASGNYQVTNFSGKYRGAYQFDQTTWETVGGKGDPAAATPAEQDKRAAILYATRGSSPWPYCGRYLVEAP